MLGIQYPIAQAGMGFVARAELVAAVSNAGGLGVLGGTEYQPDAMRDEIRQIKRMTDKPFGVDIILPTMPAEGGEVVETFGAKVQGQLEVILDERPAVFATGLGSPGARYIDECHRRGIKVISLAGNTRTARRLEAAGADFVGAQGHEAGGHTGRVALMALVPQVVDAVKVPVLAAGSIVDGRGLVAALALGACGVWMGTRFICTKEAYGHIKYKEKILEIDDEGTVVTRAYSGKPCRVIRNRFTEEWKNREAEILPFPLQREQIGGEEFYFSARRDGNVEWGSMPAGQGSGLIRGIKSAQEVVADIMAEARRVWEEEIYNR